MFTLCYVVFFVFVFRLSFIFSFVLHPSCIIPLLVSSFLSLLPLDWFVYSWQKGREFTENFPGVFHHFYITHVHILRKRNSTSCTSVGEMNILRERRHFLEILVLLYACFLVVLWCFELCLVSMLCCSHRIVVMCWTCIHPYACLDDYLLCYAIIVVISIWLFWCMIKLLICFTSCLLERNLFVTLYLSFYYLLYLKGSNVFYANVSGYRYICSKFITALMIHDKGSDMIGGEREKELCDILTMFSLLIVHDYV